MADEELERLTIAARDAEQRAKKASDELKAADADYRKAILDLGNYYWNRQPRGGGEG